MKRKGLHDDSNRKKRRQRCRQRCGHCQQFLSNSQFREHRRLYFNSSLKQWKKVEDARKSSVPEDVPWSSSSESEGELIILNTLQRCLNSAYVHVLHWTHIMMILIVDEKSIVIIWWICRTSITSKVWVPVFICIEFDRFWVLVFEFIKSPNIDQHQISPWNVNPYSAPDDMRTRDMITQVEFSWYFK